GGQLSASEKELREFYKRLLNFTITSPALMGKFQEIQTANRDKTQGYDPGIYSYVRWSEHQKLIIVNNFSWMTTSQFGLKVPAEVISKWKLKDGKHKLSDALYGKKNIEMEVVNGEGKVMVSVGPSESLILSLQ
ncbi:MAG TPA: hypothetical protein VK528_06235, partial [Flavobacterium sp.]|nr:hypothetical protein [Flavobacterium sp.]